MGANYSLVPVNQADIVEVRFDKNLNRGTVCTAFYSAIKRSGLPVKVSARNGKIYLIKKEEDQ